MTIPTTGSYSGIDIYQTTDLAALGGTIGSSLTTLEQLASTAGIPALSDLIADLAAVYDPIETTSTVTFTGTTITSVSDSGNLLTLSDAQTGQMGPNAFTFTSGGTGYLLSNGPVGGITVDEALTAALTVLNGNPLTELTVSPTVIALQQAIDAQNLGDAVILPGSFFNGATYSPPCFVRGTLIATPRGEVAVEDLVEGDQVRLARGGTARIRWIGRRRVDFSLKLGHADALPVCIRAGALGGSLPRRDLRVSPDHALFMDGVLVPAGLLVNGSSIVSESPGRVEYFHVELHSHDILLAEGAPAESYIDTGNREKFGNCPLSYDPISATQDHCAELVVAGERLERVRAHVRMIAARHSPVAA